MKFIYTFFLFVLFASNSNAQSKHKDDINAIKSMCGCFEIDFKFAETFNYSNDSNYIPSKTYNVGALEYAQLVEETENKLVIQHLLVFGGGVMKHWRQDWLYENNDFMMYNHDNKWTYKNLSDSNVAGQWTQKVYQVDDSPRYEGSASWVHVDGKHYWENTTDAPLPRREHTKRSDYNVSLRTNRHEILENGWVHDQDNKKVVREEDIKDLILAEEKGINTYNRVDDSKCPAAVEWWNENKDFWSNVRNVWDDIYTLNSDLELHEKVEGKRLYSVLFNMDTKTSPKKIKKSILKYVKE